MTLWFIFICGALLAGFVQGLTGFAFALVAMSFWIWVLPPQVAAPLVVIGSLWSHLIAMRKDRHHPLSFNLVMPYLIGGLIGVPFGVFLLHLIEANLFKAVLGTFLMLWCPIMYFSPQIQLIQKSGKYADSIIGFSGGILGGLGGYCGTLPSAWVMLKELPREQQRHILRHFNFSIQIFTLVIYLWRGNITMGHLNYIAILMISVSIPALLGAQLFYKISAQQFKHIVLTLLFVSGCFMSISYWF